MIVMNAPNAPVGAPEQDRRRFSEFAGLLIATAFTGFATFVVNRGGTWEQWAYLVHTVQGVVLAALVGRFVYLHYRRTVGLRRPAVSVSGILAVLIALAFLGTGLHMVVFGQFEAARSVYWVHIISASLSVLAIGMHVVWHRATHGQL